MTTRLLIKRMLLMSFVFFVNINVFASPTDGCIISGSQGTLDFLKTILGAIRWGAPVIIIIMSMVDFSKAVTEGSAEGMNKASKRLMMRLVIGMVLFLIPNILNIILKLIGSSTCGL